jgi:hypothetical protein
VDVESFEELREDHDLADELRGKLYTELCTGLCKSSAKAL